ncbi:MAG TPA: phage antirepressor KilAC domain-containing protein [Noviherbaspirillum sp.]|nr:phage antirepressor KilAC domain-containing protein [Noviherbaspirillum sp.]
MDLITTTKSLTMSSREIADLVGSRHDSVKRSIERLAEDGIISFSPAVESSHDGPGSRPVEIYRLQKRDSIVVVAQLCPEFTARIVDRWQELEAQISAPAPQLPNFSDPVAAARAWADAKESERNALIQLEAAKPAIEFIGRYVESNGEKGFREVCKLLKANEARFREFLIAERIMYVLAGKLMPYAPHIDAGRFVVKTGVNEANQKAFTQAKFTTKGIEFVAGRWTARLAEAA